MFMTLIQTMLREVLSIHAPRASCVKSVHERNGRHKRPAQQNKNMKMITQSVMAAAVCLLAGCETTGLSSRERAGASYPNYILSLQPGGTNAPAQKPVVPIRLAVAQVGESAPPETMLDQLTAQPTLVASVVALPLPGEPENYSNYNYNRANHPGEDYAALVKSICSLAHAAGADYVFLFGGNIDSWQENNSLSVFDITLIGGVILPGSKINLEGKGAGVLIESATGKPVLFVSTEAKKSASSPDMLAEGKTTGLRTQVRDELVRQLTGELLKKLAE
jgi:hypothetical protein